MVRQIDIARETGLSLTAVSRALGPKGKNDNLSAETREIIRKAAERMGYTGSRLEAAALRRGQTPSIRVWLCQGHNLEISELTQGIANEALLCNYPLTFHFFNAGQSDYLDFIDQINQKRNTGVIFYVNDQLDYNYLKEGFDEYRKKGGKIVLLNNNLFDLPDVTVNKDEVMGGELAAEYLLQQGCEVFFCCHSSRLYCQMRSQGFAKALAGRKVINIPYASQNLSQTKNIAQTIINTKGGKKGIFFTRRQLVNVILFDLYNHGMRINHDVFPIRFDNIPNEGVPIFSYPSVVHPYREIGKLAVRKLYNLLNGHKVNSETTSPFLISD